MKGVTGFMSVSPLPESPIRRAITARVFATAAFLTLALVPISLALTACLVRPDSLAALILVPPWFWVLCGVPSIVWAARVRHRFWLVGLVVVWAGFAVGFVEEATSLTRSWTQSFRSKPPAAKTIRIVSLNCANTVRCVEDLQMARSDIALLQEIPGPEELQQITRTLFGEEGVLLAGDDTAILSRGRIEALNRASHGSLVSGIVTLPSHRPQHCISVRRTPPVFRLDGWSKSFWTEHQTRRETHRQEAIEIKAALNDLDSIMPRIVGGDLNAPPLDPTLEILKPTVRDAFLFSGVGLGGTGTNDFPLFRVDQTWVGVSPQLVFVQKTKHSDHRMVVCDLLVPE